MASSAKIRVVLLARDVLCGLESWEMRNSFKDKELDSHSSWIPCPCLIGLFHESMKALSGTEMALPCGSPKIEVFLPAAWKSMARLVYGGYGYKIASKPSDQLDWMVELKYFRYFQMILDCFCYLSYIFRL